MRRRITKRIRGLYHLMTMHQNCCLQLLSTSPFQDTQTPIYHHHFLIKTSQNIFRVPAMPHSHRTKCLKTNINCTNMPKSDTLVRLGRTLLRSVIYFITIQKAGKSKLRSGREGGIQVQGAGFRERGSWGVWYPCKLRMAPLLMR